MKLLRKLYIKTTDFTHGYQGKNKRIISFYHLWAPFYDISIKLDPAYYRNLRKMIDSVVSSEDITLDVGCGTGLGAIYAATIAKKIIGIDSSIDMLSKLKKKIKKQKIPNIVLGNGFFPKVINKGEMFQSIISSFMLAHVDKKERMSIIKDMFNLIESNGKIGLFSAQGEIASTFQTKEEIKNALSFAGFHNIIIEDIDDIYRISIAEK